MGKINSVNDLNDRHIYYIVHKLSLPQTPEKVKDQFETFFDTKIDGNVILDVALDHQEEIKSLRQKSMTTEDIADIRIANMGEQLKMLEEVRDEAMKGTPLISKDGEMEYKKDLNVARQCVVDASKILLTNREQKRRENPPEPAKGPYLEPEDDNDEPPQITYDVTT